MPRDYVVDLAGVLGNDAANGLNAYLGELEQKTTAQVLILTVQSLDGLSIEEFAFTTKERWKLGRKGKDNGVLIVVAVKDRKYGFEVGYGLESVLPDSLVGSIGREYLVPYFRKGDYGSGIAAAAAAITQTIATSEGVRITGLPDMRRENRSYSPRPLGTAQGVLFIIFAVIPQPALESLRRAEALDSSSPMIPYARATILARMGRLEEARAATLRALELHPDLAEAQQLLRQLSR